MTTVEYSYYFSAVKFQLYLFKIFSMKFIVREFLPVSQLSSVSLKKPSSCFVCICHPS